MLFSRCYYYALWLTCLCVAVVHADVPPSFDCLMRKLAYDFGTKKLLPRLGNFYALYYALDLNQNSEDDHCYLNLEKEESSSITAKQQRRLLRVKQTDIPDDAVYAAPQSTKLTTVSQKKKQKLGSKEFPFLSIQDAVDHAATKTHAKHVVLRGGTYYLSETVLLNATHSGLHLSAFPGELPVVSGGTLLKMNEWKPYNNYKKGEDHNIWVTKVLNENLNEFPGLQINGERATRARYPNLPGGIEVSCGYGCMISQNLANWTPPVIPDNETMYYTDTTPEHTRGPNGGWFEHYTIGTNGYCSVYDPPVSYWCSNHPAGGGASPFKTPSGVTPLAANILPNGPYSKNAVDDAIVFVWRPGRWANWMFGLESYNATSGEMAFGSGGNQGARGQDHGGDWFIENLLEELDHPNEFYYDPRTSQLYLWHNGTGAPPSDTEFVVPQLRTILNVSGLSGDVVSNVAVDDIHFRATRYTYMDAHGVPSAGDWALERNAAIFLQSTRNTTIHNCIMERLDGNGLMISGYNRNTTIRDCDFAYIGGTAIASWGYTNETDHDPGRPGVKLENAPAAGIDMTDGEHPRYNRIEGCTAREVGLYEKQSSFYMQAKTMYTTITGNVFFNGPRAGINFNDGGGGGDEVSHNLVFSTCRESGDHGPFNSWDRQPFLTLKDNDPNPSMGAEWRTIHHNFFIDNYSPQENVDNDDGSAYFETHDNFLVYGYQGQKNDFGGHDNRHSGNIYAYITQPLGICKQLDGHENHFVQNKAVVQGDTVGSLNCNGPGKTILNNNQYFTPTGDIQECDMSLKDWQDKGNDLNSTVTRIPKDEVIIGWARDLLGF